MTIARRPKDLGVMFVVCLIVGVLGYSLLQQCLESLCQKKEDFMAVRQKIREQRSDIHQMSSWEEQRRDIPGLVPPVVHYVWCGDKKFRFKDYLSVLSAIKTFRPLKLMFHYTHLPQMDTYNDFFKTLTSATAELEMQKLATDLSCRPADTLKTALGFLSAEGGVFVAENVILSPTITDVISNSNLQYVFSKNISDGTRLNGIVIAKTGFSNSLKNALAKVTSAGTEQPSCQFVDNLNVSLPVKYCAVVPGIVYPRDIIETKTSFAELARWVFYGKRDPISAERDTYNLIPRTSHFLRFTFSKGSQKGPNFKTNEFPFCHFLSVLSALYVAGFEHVYIHAEEEPQGRWWDELAGENVTVVQAARPSSIFQQPVKVLPHLSDIARYMILYKYGGVYQDFDAYWTSYVPDSLLSYPVVLCKDFAKTPHWPDSINLGVMLSRPRAQWLRHHIDTNKDFRDDSWRYNPILMPYRTYENYPHLVHLHSRLQVICYGLCHPIWEASYLRDISDQQPTLPFNIHDVYVVHVTYPKPPTSLSTPDKLKGGTDMYAEIGRLILEKSGRMSLIS